MANQPLTTAQIADKLLAIREEKRTIEARKKELNEEWRKLEFELITRLEEQGQEGATTKNCTATINETILPTAVDWDTVYAHILETGDFHLLHRRISSGAFREIVAAGESVPGLEPYVQKTIGLRKK